jgi:hypothetical protein
MRTREKAVQNFKAFLVVASQSLVLCTVSSAEENTQQEMRSLDEQVQEIKTDVLSIARDLSLLEERLLYPSNTQLAVFVAMDADGPFRLDAVRIEIDGDAVAHYIYSFKELEALQKGGVQRVFTGNIPTGAHSMTVSVDGKLQNGRDFSSSESFSFDKNVDPKLLGLTLEARAGGASIELGNW